MKLTEFFSRELEREVERSRVVLAEYPEGKFDWKPHAKSMIFGYLANMVATIPTWITMQITQRELDVAPATPKMPQARLETRAQLIDALDKAAAAASAALAGTTEEHLQTAWRLLQKTKIMMEGPRWQMIQDTFNHWAHHRGQMTVYLRLLDATVPSTYGPSADDGRFR